MRVLRLRAGHGPVTRAAAALVCVTVAQLGGLSGVARAQGSAAADAVGFGPVTAPSATDATPSGRGGSGDAGDAEVGDADVSGTDGADVVGFGDAVGFGAVDAHGEVTATGGDDAEGVGSNRHALSLRGTLATELALRPPPAGRGVLAKARAWTTLTLRYQRGLFRAQVGGHAAYDLAYLDNEPAVDRDAYERLVRIDESYLALSGAHAELATGALVHAMGTADLLGVVDVVAPRDLREPGLTDPAATRLPTFSSRLSLFFGPHRLEVGVLHEAHYGLRPAPLGEFSPVRDLLLNAPGVAGTELQVLLATRDLRYQDDVRGVSRRAQQPFARARFELGPVSAEVIYARLRDRLGLLRFPEMEALANPRVDLPLAHPFYDQLGVAAQGAVGAWVLSFEALAEVGKPIAVADPSVPAPVVLAERRDLFGAVLGLRYEGLPGVVLSAEHRRATYAPNDRAESNGDALRPLLPFTLSATALRYQHRLARDRVELELALVVFGDRGEGGLLGRAFVSYRPTDALRLRLGYLLYHEGREPGPLRGFGHSDRVQFDLRWDFAAQRS
ncbi:MAG: hypothetical protein R3B40_19325 [Polyangiales bacterium]